MLKQKLAGLVLVAVAPLAATTACMSPEHQAGTNTSWYLPCDEDAACGDELVCLCGRCSEECSTDADCPAGGVCALEEAVALQCAGSGPRSCQPECMSDADCESGSLCHRGACTDALVAQSCPPEALFCEDFEGDIGDYVVAVTEGNSAATSVDEAISGSSALRSVVSAAPSTAYLRGDIPAQNSGELYLSGWVRLPEAQKYDVSPFALWSFLDEDWALRVVVRNSSVEVWSYTTSLTPVVPLTSGGWQCLQLRVTLGSGSEGSVELFLNGESAVEATGIDTLPVGDVNAVAFGTVWAGTEADMFVDRVVVSPSPVSCWQ